MSIEVSDLQKEGDVEFFTLTYTVEFDTVDLWQGKYLNQGYYERRSDDDDPCERKRIKVCGKDCVSPQLLDADGFYIDDPTPANATYQEHDIYEEMNFGVLPVT
jgi:hypothetical protein